MPAGHTTRPTRSLVRQALFNMLGERVHDAAVLDLYSGSGALGLEALSRGAASVVFVERDRRALRALKANIAECRLQPEQARVLEVSVDSPASLLLGPFDLILADPPFARLDGLPADLDAEGVLSEGACLAVHLPSERLAGRAPAPFKLEREKAYGRSRIVIFESDS
ncbi:MAG: rRNA methyltransferase [Planctomycetota bacterium]|nr:MAG: rRNA methyltransferase [Planctomycetota bacterium]